MQAIPLSCNTRYIYWIQLLESRKIIGKWAAHCQIRVHQPAARSKRRYVCRHSRARRGETGSTPRLSSPPPSTWFLIFFNQEAVQEKECIDTQLAHVRGRKDTVNQQQHAFQLQLDEVRNAIEEFEERRTTYVVRIPRCPLGVYLMLILTRIKLPPR